MRRIRHPLQVRCGLSSTLRRLIHLCLLVVAHILLFNSGIQQWKENKIIGNGLKSFRINCEYAKFKKFNDYHFCGTHPHNYTIEIMAETGLIGVFLIYTLF